MWQDVDKHAAGASADEDQSESAGKIFTLESVTMSVSLCAAANATSG